jgi:hypothetical protein
MNDEPDVRIYIAVIVVLIVGLLLLMWLFNPTGVDIQTNIIRNL